MQVAVPRGSNSADVISGRRRLLFFETYGVVYLLVEAAKKGVIRIHSWMRSNGHCFVQVMGSFGLCQGHDARGARIGQHRAFQFSKNGCAQRAGPRTVHLYTMDFRIRPRCGRRTRQAIENTASTIFSPVELGRSCSSERASPAGGTGVGLLAHGRVTRIDPLPPRVSIGGTNGRRNS